MRGKSSDDAIIEYYLSKRDVEALTSDIGDALANSFGEGKDATEIMRQAYAMVWEDTGPDDCIRRHEHHDGNVEAFLSKTCLHCLQAHRLIQERKLARRRHGRAKAALQVMGRRLAMAEGRG